MRRIVVDMQNALFTDAIAAALRNFDSDFEVFESELPQKTAELCGDVRADVLIAEVTSCTPWTFEDRMKTRSELKKICPELDSLNIGGGFPIKNSLGFNYDYEYMTEEIVAQIKNICNLAEVEEPIRVVHGGRKRRDPLFDHQPEAAERPGELVYDR